jgi:signal transduction histidine kinase
MNQILEKRVNEQSRQPVSLELINDELNQLAKNINICFKAEENLRLEVLRGEKKFKELIANISHDLRTPLTAVKGYLQLLEKDELTNNQIEKLAIAIKHTNELDNLIEQFFEYAYLINHEPKINWERMNLTNLVTECIVVAVTMLEENNINVDYIESKPIYINGDLIMMTRIIQNLIRNCAKHGGGDIKIRLKATDQVILSFSNPVKDMQSIDTERLFERFYTGDSSRNYSGGLGLSIVKILVEQMGGTVGAALKKEILDVYIRMPICV